MEFKEEDFYKLEYENDFSYTNIARVANAKLKQWEEELKKTIESNNNAFPTQENILKPVNLQE